MKKKEEARAQQIATQTKKRGRNDCGKNDHESTARGRSTQEDVQHGAGIDWVQCVCTHWLHEECGIDCIVDANGKERLCRHCI